MDKSILVFLKSPIPKACKKKKKKLLKEVDVKCRNKWSVFLMEGSDQETPSEILYVAEEKNSDDSIEVVRVIKTNQTTKSTDLMTLNDWAIKCQVKFSDNKCKVMKKGGKSSYIQTVLSCHLSEKRSGKHRRLCHQDCNLFLGSQKCK